MIDQHGLQRGNGKAGGDGEKAESEHEADRTPAQQHGSTAPAAAKPDAAHQAGSRSAVK